MLSTLVSVLCLGFALLPFRHCLDNGLAITPPMGYNTWNAFHEEIDETMVMESAEILISSGLAAAGYTYFNLDGASFQAAWTFTQAF
jgi:alpha-galactosidase